VDDLEAAERALLDALQRGDVSGGADLLREDFVITTAGWLPEPVGKAAWLEGLSVHMTLERYDLRVITTRRYGDVGVVLAESRQEGTHDGAPYSMSFRYTDVWVLEGGGWRLAIRHASSTPVQKRSSPKA
jgi:ketosteroid isomerase-like protein